MPTRGEAAHKPVSLMVEPITCRCPTCRARYRVPSSALGRHARCRRCGGSFRVAETFAGPPTEDDILRWLREAEESDEAAVDAADAAAENPDGSDVGVPLPQMGLEQSRKIELSASLAMRAESAGPERSARAVLPAQEVRSGP